MYIGIDISFAKNIAIAWTYDGEEIFFDSIKFEKSELDKATRDFHKMAKKVYKYLVKTIQIANNDDTHIGIEGQFFSVNPAMVMGLIEIRSLVQGMILAKCSKANQYTVDPRKWQAKILHVSRMKSKEIKEISKKEAALITKKNPTEDESDAIHILRYIMEESK